MIGATRGRAPASPSTKEPAVAEQRTDVLVAAYPDEEKALHADAQRTSGAAALSG
jgi:hypothetical protein